MSPEAVHLVPYDPRWPEMFSAESERLRQLLGSQFVLRFEHIGSTAIPGLSAKPIIDILIEIPSFESALIHIVPKLQQEGWEYHWRDDRPPGHMYFVRRNSAGMRTHHVHMLTAGHPGWERVAFRDYLRAVPEEAKRYAQLKRELSAKYPEDREAYTEAKSEYIKRITALALAQMDPTGERH